jgi:polyisoprenoid-binding protein YceI
MSANLRAFAASLVLGLLAAEPCAAEPYTFDTKEADVRFAYSLPFSTGRGRFTGVSGTADINDAKPEKGSVDVMIDTRTLKASDSLAEGELRGSSFFSVAKYPTMHFKSRSIRPKSATTYEISGDMTVKGVTRPIVLQVELQAPGAARGVRKMRAVTRIRRSEFNMTAYAFLVSDTVEIEIRAPLVPAH